VNHVPPPRQLAHADEDFRMLATTLGADPFIGRILTGRVEAAALKDRRDGQGAQPPRQKIEQFRVSKILAFRGLSQQDIDEARPAISSRSRAWPRPPWPTRSARWRSTIALPAQPIDPPTISVTFGINDSPLAGRDGKKVQSRVIRDRLMKEAESNVAIRVADTPGGEAFEVSGRGELQMGVLIENMRREGFELSISRPQVILRDATAVTARADRGSHHRRR
jgi:GTP-binding protein